jgi:hypothetical protein
MRTLTAYGIAVAIVFAILNGIFWLVSNPRLHSLNVLPLPRQGAASDRAENDIAISLGGAIED